MQVMAKNRKGILSVLSEWMFPTISEKMKFAIKASLSIALVYLIAFSQGWGHATTSAITIMMIASLGSLGDSVTKGSMRVVGTLIGATIGLMLIALFPQDRMAYLIAVSISVTLLLYLARAYRGDMTIFFMTALTIMIIFQDANAQNAFMYGIERTYMTIFGIVVYTAVGLFLWPVDIRQDAYDAAVELSQTEAELFDKAYLQKSSSEEMKEKLYAAESRLESMVNSYSEVNLSRAQWSSIIYDYQKIDEQLMLLLRFSREHSTQTPENYLPEIHRLEEEISTMLKSVPEAWSEGIMIEIPEAFGVEADHVKLQKLSLNDAATLVSIYRELSRLHDVLRKHSAKLNSINSSAPTHFEIGKMPRQAIFNWFDIEDMKGTLVSLLVFWASVAYWILFNPPGGFYIVTIATAMSIQTAFTPIKPSLMMILFSISFLFAAAAYILVLPQLHYGWELALFIFFYSFVGFYFIDPKLSIFFLLGLSTFNLTNTMYYNFALFLLILFLFYTFLYILLFFYYIPFSTKAEHLLETLRKRFFFLAGILLKYSGREGLFSKMIVKYASLHLINTVKKMELWASRLDTKYYDEIYPDKLREFLKSCEEMAYLLKMMSMRESNISDSELMRRFRKDFKENYMSVRSFELAKEAGDFDIDRKIADMKRTAQSIGEKIREYISGLDRDEIYSPAFGDFMERLSLRKSVALAFVECQIKMGSIPFETLQKGKF